METNIQAAARQRPKILSVMPTRQCTAQCNHCGTFSSPHAKIRLDEETITNAITRSKSLGFEVVVFTGGEATLVGDALLKYIELSTTLGMITRLVTNGHWAVNEQKAEAYVQQLSNAGLVEINFSTGDEHVRFVELDNVVRGAIASLKANFTTAIMIELTRNRTITRQVVESNPLFQSHQGCDASPTILINESPWMSLDPRESLEYPDGIAVDKSNVHLCRGCDSVLSTLTIQSDGSTYACCGLGMTTIPELRLGDAKNGDLSSMSTQGNDDFLKHWLSVEGPERIIAWAASLEPDIEWEGMYAHRCQACIRLYKDPTIRKVIRENFEEKVPEVVALDWLLYHME
jgi:hypothetical protein